MYLVNDPKPLTIPCDLTREGSIVLQWTKAEASIDKALHEGWVGNRPSARIALLRAIPAQCTSNDRTNHTDRLAEWTNHISFRT